MNREYDVTNTSCLQAILDNMSDSVIFTDKEFLVQECNHRAENFFGFDTETVKGIEVNEVMALVF